MGTLNQSKVLTCYTCTKWIAECHELIKDTHIKGETTNKNFNSWMAISIAGGNDGDADEEWASDESEQEEDNSPRGRLTNNATFATNVDEDATRTLAFQVGPVRDGIVLINTLPPASLTPNYYVPLSTEEKPTVFQCMNSAVVETTPPQQIRKKIHPHLNQLW
jgi:hypothetical protein